MKKEIFQFDKWLAEYTTKDGARLDKLTYDNYDLMTTKPESFQFSTFTPPAINDPVSSPACPIPVLLSSPLGVMVTNPLLS